MLADEEIKIAKEMLADGKVALLIVGGAINVNTFDKLEAEIQTLFKSGIYKIIVDVGGVKYVSSAGAGVIMNAFLQAQENDGKFVLVNLSHSVKNVMDLLNLQNVIPIVDDRKSALALFA